MEPKDFARIILRRRRTVVTAILIVMFTAFLGSMRKAPTFNASCEVLFQAVGYDITDPNARSVETVGSLQSNARILAGPEIATMAAKRLKLPPQDVAGKVNVTVVPDTQIFQIQSTVNAPRGASFDPVKRSADICNAYAFSYVEYKKAQARTVFEDLLRQTKSKAISLRKQLLSLQTRLDAARPGSGEYLDLEISRNGLLQRSGELETKSAGVQSQLDSGIEGGGQVTSPSVGGRRVSADHKRDLLLGLIVGLMFGIGIALVREYLDDTVRDKESTQRDLGLPVLANLPPAEGMEGFAEPSSATVEAARTLRATLASLGFPHERSMLVITSTLAKSRSTTLVSLAAAVAESGRTVLVVGADLRHGRTHEGFGIANTVGLANVVRGQVQFERAIRPAPGLDGVYVLPCGPIIGNPGELLSSEEMAFTLRKARRWADVVLIDAPPVLAAADASILGAYADGCVLVLAAGYTNRAQANEAKDQLVAAGARVLGAVLIGSDEPATRGVNGNGHGDDLPPMMPFGEWATPYGQGGSDDWYGDEVLTATARTAPRPSNGRRAPAKKTAAASVKKKPAGGGRKSPAPLRRRTGARRTTGARGTASPRRAPAPRRIRQTSR